MAHPTTRTEADLEAWLSVLASETAEHEAKNELVRVLATVIVNDIRSPGITEVCKRLSTLGSEQGA